MRLFRSRKHPIKRDAAGRSTRQRAFELFGEGQRPAQVCKTIGIPARTAYRYFESFKKQRNKVPYSKVKKWMRANPEFSSKVIDLLSTSLDMSREEVIKRLQRPWGLHQAMKGEWPNYRLDKQRTEIEARLLAVLEVVNFADKFGQKDPKKVREILQQLIMGDGGEEKEKTQ